MAQSVKRKLEFPAAAACLAAACAGSQITSPAGAALAGTIWQLISIQSMDDAQGTTRVAEPARFTLRLGADGRAHEPARSQHHHGQEGRMT